MNLAMSMFLQYFCHTLNKTKKTLVIALMNKKTWQKQRERLNLQQWTRYARILLRIGKSNKDMQQQSRKH